MNKMLEEIKKEILEKTKDVELIFVYGSYAFGQMQKYSDIDLSVLTKNKPKKERIYRFVEYEGRKILLTIHFHKFSDDLKGIRNPDEWVWVYMAYMHAIVLFDRDQNMEKIRAELEKHKVSSEYFFKFVPEQASYLLEYVGKLKNTHISRDELNIFFAARMIAEICYNLLRPFNPVWKYTSERETYISLLELENKPRHYVEDFKICYGLTMEKRSNNTIYKSAMRVARETASFLRKNKVEKRIEDKDFLHFFRSKEYTNFLK